MDTDAHPASTASAIEKREASQLVDPHLAGLIEANTAGGERTLAIGEMARECDVTLRALRFYEGKGLLKPNRDGTTRAYDATALRRLRIIVRAKLVGFSLIEIRELLDLIFSAKPLDRRLGGTLERLRRQVGHLEDQQREVANALTTITDEIRILESRIGGA